MPHKNRLRRKACTLVSCARPPPWRQQQVQRSTQGWGAYSLHSATAPLPGLTSVTRKFITTRFMSSFRTLTSLSRRCHSSKPMCFFVLDWRTMQGWEGRVVVGYIWHLLAGPCTSPGL